MNDERDDMPTDDRYRALLGSLDGDAAPLDAATLAALRENSLQIFLAAGSESPTPGAASVPTTTRNNGTRTMNLLLRAAAIAMAAAAGVLAWLNVGGPEQAHGAPFAKVLDKLRMAETIEFRIHKGEQLAQVWVRTPGLVRYEESPHRYRIAAGSRLWQIDETENTAVSTESPWFISPDEQVDLLGLLEVGIQDGRALLKAQPAGHKQYDGRDCVWYRAELPGQEHQVAIEAFVDAQSDELRGILARRPGVAAGPPLAELQLVALNAPVNEDKFKVAATLTEDGRIGKISDAQGVVTLRPMTAKRWTPVCRETLLKPGDWLRTDIRGANAVKARLSSNVELILGPGTLVEWISPMQARVHAGEVQVQLPEPEKKADAVTFELRGPGATLEKLTTAGKNFYRVTREEKLAAVAQPPKWLAGFEGTASNETLGSLLVTLPDGRNEPLTVGYHKVNVEIRDQIARTTIEESFVNHTKSRLEGVFHFPLPQDASISNFGMWIGNELVEADVVEKQRAREIYETILRENRDPGLLEWTVGNLFKARVFPIEPNSEKRVKIVYTQVLPLQANRYRYSYALQSDLLRKNPLRELSVNVTVNSAIPLKSVHRTSHTVREQHTDHSASLEFTAQEYTPTKDFEAVFEIDGQQSDVVAIPHRRGDDGYLLVQLTPPGVVGNWQRQMLPDGQPLNLVLLCDTSASMDSDKRKQQAEFVATVLASLGEKDRFQLAAADVATAWGVAEPTAASPDTIAQAKDFLEQRVSLGWTDLNQAFTTVLKKAPVGAQIIYIGDGIVTAGERDPAAAAARLTKLVADQKKPTERPTFHAVTVGNTSERTVLSAISAIGSGSVRAIAGDKSAQLVATELLNEIAQPGLRDINVEFRGVRVAAMYPQRLPNLPAGTQHILVGRYLPEGKDQRGEVIVTGKRGSETVRYAAKISFPNDDAGNSFIPRLWARGHLDYLLLQGQSAEVRDQVIALSEEFHIITPYTSLLVLETDADRERFGVKRRHDMRDGEKFFQEGRDRANYELVQQQLKRAADWRLELRRRALRELAGLGRNPRLWQQHRGDYQRQDEYFFQRNQGLSRGGSPGSSLFYDYDGELSLGERALGFESETVVLAGTLSVSGGTTMNGRFSFNSHAWREAGNKSGAWDTNAWYLDGAADEFGLEGAKVLLTDGSRSMEELSKSMKDSAWDVDRDSDGVSLGLRDLSQKRESLDLYAESLESDIPAVLSPEPGFAGGKDLRRGLALDFRFADAEGGESELGWQGLSLATQSQMYKQSGGTLSLGRRVAGPDFSGLHDLFPNLPAPVTKAPLAAPEPETWNAEALALAKSLLRQDALLKLENGLEIRRTHRYFNPRWKQETGSDGDVILWSPKRWVVRPMIRDAQVIVQYAQDQERGAYSPALLLGSVRPAVAYDFEMLPFSLDDSSLTRLFESHRTASPTIESVGADKVVLTIRDADNESEYRYTIDTKRHVLLKYEYLHEGQLVVIVVHEDFVELAGQWWAQKTRWLDNHGEVTGEENLAVKLLPLAEFAKRAQAEMAELPATQLLRLPLPKLAEARQRVTDGGAKFEDHLVVLLHFVHLQQWEDVQNQLAAAEKLAGDKTGLRWVRTTLLTAMRKNDEVRQRLLTEARQLAKQAPPEQAYLLSFILNHAQGVCGTVELEEFLTVLRPVYDRLGWQTSTAANYRNHLYNIHEARGRFAEALALRRENAERAPWDTGAQAAYAHRLVQSGDRPAAYAWLTKQLARPEHERSAQDSLRNTYADMLRAETRWEDLLHHTTDWQTHQPVEQSAYQQHLSALVFNDKLAEARKLAQQWLRDAQIEEKLPPEVLTKARVAISFAQGNSYSLSFQRMEEDWHEPLAQAIRFFLKHPKRLDLARSCFEYRFSDTDAADRLRYHFLQVLAKEADTLRPKVVEFLVSHSLSGRMEATEPVNGKKQLNASEIPDTTWKSIADALRKRWDKADWKHGERQTLGEALRTIYANRFADEELLPFLRVQLTAGRDIDKPGFARQLFDTLLSRPWTAEREAEAWQLITPMSASKTPAAQLVSKLDALHRFVDAELAGRITAAEKAQRDKGQNDKPTRAQLAEQKQDHVKAARTGLVDFLTKQSNAAEAPFAAWVEIERNWLLVQLDRNLDQVAAQCWKILDRPEIRLADEAQRTPEQIAEHIVDAQLRQRALVTVMNLAARSKAPPAAGDRVLKFIDAKIAARGDHAAHWRPVKYQFLIVLDRPDELEKQLREWIRTDVTTAPWRQLLARLLAERGKLEPAVQLFEAAAKDKLLSADDYRALSTWYQVLDRKAAYEQAKFDYYRQLPENALSRIIYRTQQRWYGDKLPTELDEETLLAYRAIFEKSGSPSNYLYNLRATYLACRDFRLLQMVPHAVLGRSPEQIYAFLANLQGQLLNEVRNESTADELLGTLKKLRVGERTVIDQRALDLLEVLVERRSAEVQNQRGPHVEACLGALQRAFARKWNDGEPVLMAGFLRQMGSLPDPRLKAEQLRELQALLDQYKLGTREHLLVAAELAELQFWNYSQKDEAVRLYEADAAAYAQAHQGVWPHEDNGYLDKLIVFLCNHQRHAAAETLIQKYTDKPANAEQRRWLGERLLYVYDHALEHAGQVSLGSGAALLKNLDTLYGERLLAADDESARYTIITQWSSSLERGHRLKLDGTADLVRKFAFEVIPQALKRQTGYYRNAATTPIQRVKESLGLKEGLRYLCERYEQYPGRLDNTWENSANAFGNELATCLHEALQKKVDIKELEPRLVSIVVHELKRQLRTGESRSDSIYRRNSGYYWAAHEADFLKAAEEVYQEVKSSGRRVFSIANYVRFGFEKHARAVEILLVAQQAGLLDESARIALITWLQADNRYAESIPLIEPLVAEHPDVMQYRVYLLLAYHHTQRPQQLVDLVKAIDAHFHQQGRWNHSHAWEFGNACEQCGLYEQAIVYLKDALALYREDHPTAGHGDQHYSHMYQQLASAHAGLGQTKAAVEAASAAIVCWPAQHHLRTDAVNRLADVLRRAKELDAFTKQWEADVAETGQDSPLLRKTLGKVYQERQQWPAAIAQYRAAIALQGNDKETRQALIAAYDATNQGNLATAQLLEWINFDRHDLKLYQQLAQRYAQNEREAERAATSIIEGGPNEAENHAALAELRQTQGRWPDAITHWREVAELRRLEPTGLLKLAAAQAHAKQTAAARETLTKLRKTEWPARFDKVEAEIREIERVLAQP